MTATTADDREQRLDDLQACWSWWADALGALDADDWSRPTRLEGWDVAALAAHHSMLVHLLGHLATSPVEGEPTVPTAVDMLRGFNAPGGAARDGADAIARMALDAAAATPPAQLHAVFAELAPRSIAAARSAGPTVVDYLGQGTFPLTEALTIFVLEAVVHGLDLAAAVPATRPLPATAVARTVTTLAAMADPVAFVEAATGRQRSSVLPVLR